MCAKLQRGEQMMHAYVRTADDVIMQYLTPALCGCRPTSVAACGLSRRLLGLELWTWMTLPARMCSQPSRPLHTAGSLLEAGFGDVQRGGPPEETLSVGAVGFPIP